MYLTPLTFPELFQHHITEHYQETHFLRLRPHAYRHLPALQSGFNHCPEDVGVWVPYNGYRYKDYYRIRLANGTVINKTRPNADVFIVINDDADGDTAIPDNYRGDRGRNHPHPDPTKDDVDTYVVKGSVNEKHVTHVMLLPDDELTRFHLKGEERFEYQRYLFGDLVPPVGTFKYN